MKPKRTIRLSQGITTYGVGAIIGLGEESFINKDINRWLPRNPPTVPIDLPRLAYRLGVKEFRYPKPKEFRRNGAKFSFMRFPAWLFCPACRNMVKVTENMSDRVKGEIPICENHSCKGFQKRKLLPMRFITVCENGHIDEFPWWQWAHSKSDRSVNGNCQTYDRLKFISIQGAGASYKALKVVCTACKAERDLSGLEHGDALKEIGFTCRGKQPWQNIETAEECDVIPRMKQRNASNIYQPDIATALAIPNKSTSGQTIEDDLEIRIKTHDFYNRCKKLYDSANEITPAIKSIIPIISSDCECTDEQVLTILEGNTFSTTATEKKASTPFERQLGIKMEEWPVFFEEHNDEEFINIPEILNVDSKNKVEQSLVSLIDHVSLVKKLKEVRAFKGFSRLKFDPERTISATLGRDTNWLPAIQVYGEGIFISIDKNKLDMWYELNKDKIEEKIKPVMNRFLKEQDEMEKRYGPFSVKFIMLHTLSHLLIRQLSFESGYNSSSLREHIYFSEDENLPMSGILIYTADADSEGSLGGLVRQGEYERLIPTIITALQRATWCSADPVCKESDGQGENGLNQAACHACSLISETSCSYFNTLLNRTLIMDEEIGFFKDVYTAIKVSL